MKRDVLYQKLGSVWYVFCESKDDFFYTSLPQGSSLHWDKFEFFEVLEDRPRKEKMEKKRAQVVARGRINRSAP